MLWFSELLLLSLEEFLFLESREVIMEVSAQYGIVYSWLLHLLTLCLWTSFMPYFPYFVPNVPHLL